MIATPEEAVSILNEMDRESKAIVKEVYETCAYMRGLTREEAWRLCFFERKVISDIIKDKFENMKKGGYSVQLI